jgi:CheY-like chemotaxis protein
MILERAGYQIVAMDDPNEAVRIFKTSVVNAVVFGDSINGDQRVQLARAFKSLNRTVPIVALSKTSGSQFPAGLVDQHLESLGDPHLLLEALQQVLSRDGDGAGKRAPVHDHDGAVHDGNSSAKSASAHEDYLASSELSGSNAPKNPAI